MSRKSYSAVAIAFRLISILIHWNRGVVEAISLKHRNEYSLEDGVFVPAQESAAHRGAADPAGEIEGRNWPQAEVRPVTGTADRRTSQHHDVLQKNKNIFSANDDAESGFLREEAGFSELSGKAHSSWQNVLEMRLTEELSPHEALQAVLLVDGGSSKTQPLLFQMKTVGRPGKPRRVLEDTIVMLHEGQKLMGVRNLLEDFLDAAAGTGWESRALESEELTAFFSDLEARVSVFVSAIIQEAASILEEKLKEEEKNTVKAFGVAVIFNSTAGIRDFPAWGASGMFVAVRRAVNKHPPVLGYKFYTDPQLTRPLSGEEEGVSAFLTANLLLGHFKRLQQDSANGRVAHAHETLAGIVEVGGASMQIVFPVPATTLPPASAQVVKTQEEGYLSSEYPPVHLLAVSYMQLGANSASGVFLKALCSDARNVQEGVCYNPCLHKNFEQDCSAGAVTITSEGQVKVNHDLKKNRLKPLATFCGEANEDIARRFTTRLTCLATYISPRGKSLQERVSIPHCTKIVGTGDFGGCVDKVESILLNSELALPANSEAEKAGFDSPGQIFATLSSSAPLLMTGAALVFPLKNLEKLNLLPPHFSGDGEQLQLAAAAFCSAPVEKEGKKLVVRVADRELVLDTFTYESCLRLAFIRVLLARINAGDKKPNAIIFSTKVEDPVSGKVLGNGGWPVGRIFKETQDRKEWSMRAYENGPAYSYGFSQN